MFDDRPAKVTRLGFHITIGKGKFKQFRRHAGALPALDEAVAAATARLESLQLSGGGASAATATVAAAEAADAAPSRAVAWPRRLRWVPCSQ